MSWFDGWVIKKDEASQNNYKLDLFQAVSKDSQVANFSAIKKYFNKIYNNDTNSSSSQSFNTESTVDVYAGQQTNKSRRLLDYRSMALCPEIAQAIDTICYAADIPDENNTIVKVKIKDKKLQPKEIQIIRQACQQYLDLFDFDNNLIQYFRRLVIQGQVCWQNVIAKDDLQQGIININIIPNQAYEFAYDVKLRKKIGIMITNSSVDTYNIAAQGITNVPGAGPINAANSNLNCYQQLNDNQVIVLPFEQLTYVDSGIYTSDNKAIFSPLQRARRAYNQLTLIEDAILIYRMARAPEKYMFNVDVSKMGAAKAAQTVSQLKKTFMTKKTYDPATGTIGKVYDPMQMLESFWFAKGADSQGIQVSALTSQHNFGNLDDLEYFLKKLYRALNIPISRIFQSNTQVKIGGDGVPSAQELNFAKFIMSLQKRFALGLLNGLTMHLKLKGLWDLYKLSRSSLDVIFTPPIQYQQFRKAKLLQSKIGMLKNALGDQLANKAISVKFALKYFMDWDDDTIEMNQQMRFRESIRDAQIENIIQKVKSTGKIDNSGQSTPFDKTLQQILQDGFKKQSEGKDKQQESSQDESMDDSFGGDEF